MGMRISGVRRHPAPETEIPGVYVVPLAELDALLPSADFLVLALPGTAETDGILDVRRMSLLPAACVVCNVGRGRAIDEDALADALRAGRLRAACLDVFRAEPLPADSSLRSCPNLFAFPHSSAIAPEYLDLFLDEYVALFRARRWREGGEPSARQWNARRGARGLLERSFVLGRILFRTIISFYP